MYGYEDKTYNEVLTQAVNNIEEINQAVDRRFLLLSGIIDKIISARGGAD